LKSTQSIREDIIENRFLKETKSFQSYLSKIKADLDQFDELNPSTKEQESRIEQLNNEFLPHAVAHFNKVWGMIKDLPKNELEIYQSFYQQRILPFLGEAEINRHIYRKPFGYAGDFVTMNYIYDNYDKFLGASSFEKLINKLTCMIKNSLSNIARKEFLKEQIAGIIEEKGSNVKIASIASGPARELLELLKENKVNVAVDYICFDFENRALSFIKEQYESLSSDVKKNVKISFINNNVVDVIRKPAVRKKLYGQDLIYAFGIYDYLSDIVSRKLTHSLFECLNEEGKLVLCNVSSDKSDCRTYFEFLGEWYMIYRTKAEMLQWVNGLQAKEVRFRDEPNEAYLYLLVRK